MTPEEVKVIIDNLRFAAQTLAQVRADLDLLKVVSDAGVALEPAGGSRGPRGGIRTPMIVPHTALKKRIEAGVLSAETSLREALKPVDWFE